MTPGADTAGRTWAFIAILLTGLNLRPAITSVAPVLEWIRADLGLDHVAASLLTAIPLLCMGIVPLFAGPLIDRVGLERSLFWSLLMIAAAALMRVGGWGASILFASALVAGVGVALAQAIVPGVVKQRFATRSASVVVLYSMTMTLGASLAAATTAPLARALGGWSAALAIWTIGAIVAAGAWVALAPVGSRGPARERPHLPWDSAIAWRVTMFSAGAFGLFWATQTWLVPLYEEQGWSTQRAGLLLGVMTGSQVVSQLALATIADRNRDRRILMVVGLTVAVLGLSMLALMPSASPWATAVFAGIGIGAAFPLALNLPIDFSRDAGSATRLAAMALGIGYSIASLAPLAVGWLRGLSGSFSLPFLALAGMCVAMIALSVTFRPARDGSP